MTILVDPPREYPGWKWPASHMASDDLTQAGLDELHAIAEKLNLKPSWFQGEGTRHPHYDISETKYRAAIRYYGAVPVTSQELVRRCSRDIRKG